jgi:glutathione S-transferase
VTIKIYGLPMSQHVRKTLAVAHQIDLPVELVACRPSDPILKEINPAGRMPALDDDGFRLAESNAILVYLASKRPNDLYPDDIRTRSEINQWLSWEAAHWAPSYGPIQFERLAKPFLNLGAPDETIIASALEKFRREALYLDARLKGRDWLVGDRPSLADISVGCGLTHAKAIDLPLGDYPHIRGWAGRVNGLEGMKKTAL